MIETFTNWFMAVITVFTAFSVFMHDGRLDKAMLTKVDSTVDATHLAKGDHAHVDYNGSDFLMNKSQGYSSPAVPPKNRTERRQRLQLPPEFGRHAFDDELMPILI